MKRMFFLFAGLLFSIMSFSQSIQPKMMFNEGLKGYEVDGKWGFINEQGKVVIKPQFDDVGWFSEGLCAVEINGKWGFINKKGTIVIQPKYGFARNFYNGYSVVVTNDLWGAINKKGEETVPLKFKKRISNFINDTAMAIIDTIGYYINPKGEIIGRVEYPR